MWRMKVVMALMIVAAGLGYGCGDDGKETRTIDFREKNYPADVTSVSGVSGQEAWGRWTDGATAVLQFKKRLPSAFQLKLETTGAFGPNVGLPIQLKVGSVQREFKLKGTKEVVLFDFEGVAGTDRVEFLIPKPTSPKELAMSDDSRKLGIGLVLLTIGPKRSN